MPTYVIVWENNNFGNKRVTESEWPGHSAINIGNFWATEQNCDRHTNYVSWWPDEVATFTVKKLLFGKKQKGKTGNCFQEDVEEEGYLPDHVIELPSDRTKELAMQAEWNTVLNKENGASYSALRKNCSTICSRVLHAGGYYAKKWAVDCNFAWAPSDVRALAMASGGKMLKWTDVERLVRHYGIRTDEFWDSKVKCEIDYARSGVFCSLGCKCYYQSNKTYTPMKTM